MFFTNLTRRRLASLLRPWLREDLDLDLELSLGLFNSRAIAKNLRFDASALNELIGDGTGFRFDDVSVGEFIVSFSNWSFPAFSFQVRDVNITISTRDWEKENAPIYRDTFDECMKKKLSKIDPEGFILHKVLEKISATIPPGYGLKTAFLNVVLTHCQFEIHNLNVHVKFPNVHEYTCVLRVRELAAESRGLDFGCLLKGIVGSLFIPLKKTSHDISAIGLEIVLSEIGQVDHVLLSSDLHSNIRFNDLQPIGIILRVPELNVYLSPADLSACMVLGLISSKVQQPVKSGKGLWKLAARRIDHAISSPRLKFYKVVDTVGLWLRYVNAYDCLLQLVGYSSDINLFKRTASKISQNKGVLRSIKQCWKVISDIERKLPAESVAQARRIARKRVAKNVQPVVIKQSYLGTRVKLIEKIFPIGLIWKLIFKLIRFVVCLVIFPWKLAKEIKAEGPKIACEDPSPQFCFIFNLGRGLVKISPIYDIQISEIEKLESHMGGHFSGFNSNSLSVEALLIRYVEDICEESLIVSCGKLMVECPSTMETPLMQEGSKNYLKFAKRHWDGDMKSVLWCEPAPLFHISNTSETSTTENAKVTCDPILENFQREMWLNWKITCTEFEKYDIQYPENPCLLYETSSFLTYPGLGNSDSGLLKCFFTLGKIHLDLGCSSILSISVLLSHIQLALSWTGEIERPEVNSDIRRTMNYQLETGYSIYKLYAHSRIQTLLKMLPEKHIQLGVFMDGIGIKLLLEKEFGGGTEDARHIAFHNGVYLQCNLENIEVACWSNLTSMVASNVKHPSSDEAETECTRYRQPQIIEMAKSGSGKYTADWLVLLSYYVRISGASAYFGCSADKQESQILLLQPVTAHLSSSREYFHSFSASIIALSAVLSASASGLTVSLYMDELYILSMVIVNLYNAVLYVCSSFNAVTSTSSNKFIQKFKPTESENEKGTEEETPTIGSNTFFLVVGSFKIKSMEISLQKTRRNGYMENSTKLLDSLSINGLGEVECPDRGILITFQQTNLDVSGEEEKCGISVEISEIQSVIFGYKNQKVKNMDQSARGEFLLESCNCMYEVSLANCKFSLSSFLPQNTSSSRSMHNKLGFSTSWINTSSRIIDNKLGRSTSGSSTSNLNNFITSEISSSQTSHVEQNSRSSSAITPDPDPSHSLLVDFVLGVIYVGNCSLKSAFVRAHEVNKLLSSLLIEGDFRTFSWENKGGILFLEPKAIEQFTCCFSSYFRLVTYFFTSKQILDKDHEKTDHNVDMARINDSYVSDDVEGSLRAQIDPAKEHMQALAINVSQLSTVLVFENEQGGFQELVLEFDVCLNFELANMKRNIVFDLKRLSVLSQVLQQNSGSEFQLPHFYSFPSDHISTQYESGDGPAEPHPMDLSHQHKDPSSSRDSDSLETLSAKDPVPEIFDFSYQRHILNQLHAFLSVQKHISDQSWSGSGSTSGFDIILSLRDIEMILSILSSFSGISSKMTTSDFDIKQRSNQEESDSSLEEMIPDGAIVAIQDVQQHLFFAVDSEENNYSLAGAIHYSLVGERALFRVKYHSQRRWGSSILWFSLISLHAKSDTGEPFRLNYRPGSGFVDISSTDDGARGRWRIHACEPESFDSDVNWEPYNQFLRKNFYLVNKKNDCAVAFIDGVPEFVKKPGNPFKFKVFHDHSAVRDFRNVNSHPLKDLGNSLQDNASLNGKALGQSGIFPFINVAFDKITLTIVDELSDSSDVYPLLRASIDAQLIVQALSTKTRVISTLTAAVYYFDPQRNSWTELLCPVEIYLYFRSNFYVQNVGANQGIPVQIHCRTKELNVSLSELSLDILLFVVGKLKFAGPYSIKSSTILVNCCKVENQTGTNLLCEFFNKQSVKVSRNQATSIFLRYSDLTKQPLESAHVSIQLLIPGCFSTSSVHLSLLKSQKLAWRTRIMSSQDSSTYPGPFLVVDVSRESEEGLVVLVTPLIRIHNETRFSIELRFQRPQQKADEFALAELKSGDTIDDSMAMFDALCFSGGLKKALTSLSLGNFLFSFRPNITEILRNSKTSHSVEWSDDLKGGKSVHLSGLFDKLSFKVRKALQNEAVKCSLSTVRCSLNSEDSHVADVHFLIQSIGREVPVARPINSKEGLKYDSPVSLQEQKEIFLLPTVKVSNLVQSEIHVILSETDDLSNIGSDNTLNQAVLSYGSSVDFYVNPSIIYFTVTINTYNSSAKQVNSRDLVKKLQKQNTEAQYLDIALDFGGGSYFVFLRLSRGQRGILEAVIFTSYSLKNDTENYLYFFALNKNPLARHEVEKFGPGMPPDLGLVVPPKSTRSWFLKSNKVRFKLMEDNASEALLDLDALSGLTEISLDKEETDGVKSITRLGVSVGPPAGEFVVSSQVVTMVPRYALVNESDEAINFRQCYLQDDLAGITLVNSRQRKTLHLRNTTSKRREFSLFENFIRNHRKTDNDALYHIQFSPNKPEFRWSGPVCIASIGRFFLKFRKQQSGQVIFAAVHVVEEGSTLVMRFHKPPDVRVPYRIENQLHDVSITYFQKESEEAEVLGSESSVDYVWDDFTLPHRLVVRINDSHLLREINLDKVRVWKPFYKLGQRLGLTYHLLLDKNSETKTPNVGEYENMMMVKLGYEVYADGPTRVLRICEISRSHKAENRFQSYERIQLRVLQFTVQLLEQETQDGNERGSYPYAPIVAARFGNISLDSLFTDQQTYNLINLQSLTIEQKWVGAPFAAMLRRHQVDNPESNVCIRIVFVLLTATSDVMQFEYASIALQPIDLNLDEETMMKLVPFWRTSLADPNSKSRQFYFDQFEIQPIKIIANFLPGDSYSRYSSAQETLRSLLHSVIKVPPIKNMVVELNGVLVTHALITMRELFFRCAQHYSWYAMRAIYIAKGSPLLPPDFVSMFDDLASSSLDIFFDPARGLTNLPGLTLGTFKLISKCIGRKGFSGTKRYFGDLGKSLRTAGSNVLFAAVTEISDSVLKGAEASGLNGMVIGFHQGILKLAMEPSLLGSALMEGGPDRKIKLDRNPGADELYVEGYLQAMLDTLYRQAYLRVRIIDNQVYLKNLPPNNALIDEITESVKGYLVSKALLKGDPSRTSHPLRHLRGENEWKLGPTLLTLCEHLFVSFAIRTLRKQANKVTANIKWKIDSNVSDQKSISSAAGNNPEDGQKVKFIWRWGIGRFVLSGVVAYVDGRLCRCIPNPIARRIVSGFLLSFLDRSADK